MSSCSVKIVTSVQEVKIVLLKVKAFLKVQLRPYFSTLARQSNLSHMLLKHERMLKVTVQILNFYGVFLCFFWSYLAVHEP